MSLILLYIVIFLLLYFFCIKNNFSVQVQMCHILSFNCILFFNRGNMEMRFEAHCLFLIKRTMLSKIRFDS